MDIVEELDHPDAAAVGLAGQPGEDLDIAGERLVVQLPGIGELRQFEEGGEGVTVPQRQHVHAVLDHEVEILLPLRLIVEEGKVLGGDGKIVLRPLVDPLALLQADAGAAHQHGRSVRRLEIGRQFARGS